MEVYNICMMQNLFSLHVNFRVYSFLPQAFLKFYEIVSRFPLVTSDCTGLSSVHLCEAPGAFIVALNHYLKLHRPGTLVGGVSIYLGGSVTFMVALMHEIPCVGYTSRAWDLRSL